MRCPSTNNKQPLCSRLSTACLLFTGIPRFCLSSRTLCCCVLPLVQHDFLATEKGLASNLAVILLHEFHDVLLHPEICNDALSRGMQRHELPHVVARHGERCRVCSGVRRENCSELLHCAVVVSVEELVVLGPELVGVDEAPIELAFLKLAQVIIEVAKLALLRRDELPTSRIES